MGHSLTMVMGTGCGDGHSVVAVAAVVAVDGVGDGVGAVGDGVGDGVVAVGDGVGDGVVAVGIGGVGDGDGAGGDGGKSAS